MDAPAPDTPPADPVGRILHALAAGLAVAGGFVLLALALATVASILGRNLLGAPVPGDMELLEMGGAVAVFAFLPYAQMRRAHAVADLFTARAPARVKAALDAAASLVLAGLAALLAWRMALGGAGLRAFGDTSMVLGIPVWWGFVPAVACLGLLAATAIHTAVRALGGAGRA